MLTQFHFHMTNITHQYHLILVCHMITLARIGWENLGEEYIVYIIILPRMDAFLFAIVWLIHLAILSIVIFNLHWQSLRILTTPCDGKIPRRMLYPKYLQQAHHSLLWAVEQWNARMVQKGMEKPKRNFGHLLQMM